MRHMLSVLLGLVTLLAWDAVVGVGTFARNGTAVVGVLLQLVFGVVALDGLLIGVCVNDVEQRFMQDVVQ
ncbi:Protein of unknown function [Gryllus bimaculatus]|nr:Protein of unknown function [Gryllus bimaculatus]